MTRRLVVFLGLGFFAFLFFNFTNVPWAWDCVKGKGELVEQTIDLDTFDSFSISSSADVELTKGKQKIVVVGQSNIIDLLNKDIKNGSWEIDFNKSVCYGKNFTVKITIPEIHKVSINGSGNVSSKSNFDGEELELSINGSGDVQLNIDVKSAETTINGSGSVDVKGTCDSHDITIAGSGDVNCIEMLSKRTNIKIMGSGDCKVNASDNLDVSVMGSGDVFYEGNPELESSIMGSGEIKKM